MKQELRKQLLAIYLPPLVFFPLPPSLPFLHDVSIFSKKKKSSPVSGHTQLQVVAVVAVVDTGSSAMRDSCKPFPSNR